MSEKMNTDIRKALENLPDGTWELVWANKEPQIVITEGCEEIERIYFDNADSNLVDFLIMAEPNTQHLLDEVERLEKENQRVKMLLSDSDSLKALYVELETKDNLIATLTSRLQEAEAHVTSAQERAEELEKRNDFATWPFQTHIRAKTQEEHIEKLVVLFGEHLKPYFNNQLTARVTDLEDGLRRIKNITGRIQPAMITEEIHHIACSLLDGGKCKIPPCALGRTPEECGKGPCNACDYQLQPDGGKCGSLQADQWISVEDRLPEEDVVMWYKDKNYKGLDNLVFGYPHKMGTGTVDEQKKLLLKYGYTHWKKIRKPKE